MNNNSIVAVLLVMIILLSSPVVTGRPQYLEAFKQQYDVEDTRLGACLTCHYNPNGGGPRNPYGTAYSSSGRDFASIETMDSDGDGFTNIEEINALTFPGDPADNPQTAETPSETGASEADPTDNQSIEETSAPVNDSQQQETNETSADSVPEQQSPGFGAILAVSGIVLAIYFKRKG